MAQDSYHLYIKPLLSHEKGGRLLALELATLKLTHALFVTTNNYNNYLSISMHNSHWKKYLKTCRFIHVIMLFTVVTLLEDCQEIYMYISELFQFRVLSLSGSSVSSIRKQKLCSLWRHCHYYATLSNKIAWRSSSYHPTKSSWWNVSRHITISIELETRNAKYTSIRSTMFTNVFTKIRPMVKHLIAYNRHSRTIYCTCKPRNQCN